MGLTRKTSNQACTHTLFSKKKLYHTEKIAERPCGALKDSLFELILVEDYSVSKRNNNFVTLIIRIKIARRRRRFFLEVLTNFRVCDFEKKKR